MTHDYCEWDFVFYNVRCRIKRICVDTGQFSPIMSGEFSIFFRHRTKALDEASPGLSCPFTFVKMSPWVREWVYGNQIWFQKNKLDDWIEFYQNSKFVQHDPPRSNFLGKKLQTKIIHPIHEGYQTQENKRFVMITWLSDMKNRTVALKPFVGLV